MKIKYYIQKLLGFFFNEPLIPLNKTVGYSLVRSEKSNFVFGTHTRVYAPYFLHNVELGDYSYIAKNSNVTNCKIGKFCSIGPNFCCGLGLHPTNGISTHPMFYSTGKQNGVSLVENNSFEESKQTIIGNDVFIGANVTIIDGVTIGNGVVIGAGAVVVKNIPDYAIAVGVPAKVVKYRFSNEIIENLKKNSWWNTNNLTDIAMNEFNIVGYLTDIQGFTPPIHIDALLSTFGVFYVYYIMNLKNRRQAI